MDGMGFDKGKKNYRYQSEVVDGTIGGKELGY